jgi:trimeric autotransporter adhesin
MSINLSNSLAGLSLLTGSNAFSGFGFGGSLGIETRAARVAKAQFTAPETTPPWKSEDYRSPDSAGVSAIKRMKSIIDKPSEIGTTLPDAQTTFIAFKALDRLRMVAESAANKTTSSAERAALDKTFAQGLADLQSFLGQSPNEKVQLAFTQPARRVNTVAVPSPAAGTTLAKGILDARDTPIPGLTGSETFTIKLERGSISDTVSLDLSATPQPPTLDSVAQALNAAIATVPMRDTGGVIVTDANGDPVPRWTTQFEVTKESGSWGFKLDTPGNEQVSIEQTNAPDALMVASGQTSADGPTEGRLMRFDDPTGAFQINSLNTIRSIDRLATEAAQAAATDEDKVEQVYAQTTANAVATDALGYSYVVGTAAGDLGSNRLAGTSDLFLTKLDSEGKTVWQQTLGATASAEGAAVSVAANGDIVVAGTVTGAFEGSSTDGDMVVARFSANGDEQFSSVVRAFGADKANAVAVADDGTIYVAGKSATGGGDAFIARLSATGQVQERRTIDSGGSDSVNALAIGSDGELLALTGEDGTARLRKISTTSLATDLGSIDLGARDARMIAIAADGQIAVGGASAGDGFVARIDAALTGSAFTQLATPGSDQVDSLTFMNGALYAGGRTSGDLDGTRTGSVDGFIARIGADQRHAGSHHPVRPAGAANGAGPRGGGDARRQRTGRAGSEPRRNQSRGLDQAHFAHGFARGRRVSDPRQRRHFAPHFHRRGRDTRHALEKSQCHHRPQRVGDHPYRWQRRPHASHRSQGRPGNRADRGGRRQGCALQAGHRTCPHRISEPRTRRCSARPPWGHLRPRPHPRARCIDARECSAGARADHIGDLDDAVRLPFALLGQRQGSSREREQEWREGLGLSSGAGRPLSGGARPPHRLNLHRRMGF